MRLSFLRQDGEDSIAAGGPVAHQKHDRRQYYKNGADTGRPHNGHPIAKYG
jgi:hypothetical protein